MTGGPALSAKAEGWPAGAGEPREHLDPASGIRTQSRTARWQHNRPSSDWREAVRPVLVHFTAHTPGAFVEEKTAALAWHYRMVEPELADRRAQELELRLQELLAMHR